MAFAIKNVVPLNHHTQKDVCATRPRYRQGRKDTAVKVYTINQESKYLLIIGVPAVGAKEELENLCNNFGEVIILHPLDDYPCEEFTETYLVCYARFQSSRVAKRKLDGRSLLGGVLHVCYAPEFETADETRTKLIERQKYVSISTRSGFTGPWDTRSALKQSRPKPFLDNANSSSAANLSNLPSDSACESGESTYIWAGKTYTLSQYVNAQQCDAENVRDQSLPPVVEQSTDVKATASTTRFVPRQAMRFKRQFEPAQSSKPCTGASDYSIESPKYIKDRLSKLNVPNVDVRIKRQKQS